MSFLRHHEIYRSDGERKTILSLEPGAASHWSAPGEDQGRGFDLAPFPSSAMSLGPTIPWRVARQQWGTRPVVWTIRKGTVVYTEGASGVGS